MNIPVFSHISLLIQPTSPHHAIRLSDLDSAVGILQTAIAGRAPLNRGIPAGGTVNQVLRKRGLNDFDVDWHTLWADHINFNNGPLWDAGFRANTVQQAIEELFQQVSNRRAAIADAIGLPALATNTFAQLAGHINTQRTQLAENLTTQGIPSTNDLTLQTLVNRVLDIKGAAGYFYRWEEHQYTFSNIIFIPDGCHMIDVSVIGGGQGLTFDRVTVAGEYIRRMGAGGQIERVTRLAVTPGDMYFVMVGARGENSLTAGTDGSYSAFLFPPDFGIAAPGGSGDVTSWDDTSQPIWTGEFARAGGRGAAAAFHAITPGATGITSGFVNFTGIRGGAASSGRVQLNEIVTTIMATPAVLGSGGGAAYTDTIQTGQKQFPIEGGAADGSIWVRFFFDSDDTPRSLIEPVKSKNITRCAQVIDDEIKNVCVVDGKLDPRIEEIVEGSWINIPDGLIAGVGYHCDVKKCEFYKPDGSPADEWYSDYHKGENN